MAERTDDADERWTSLWADSPLRSPFSHIDYVRAAGRAAGLETAIHFVSEHGRDEAALAVCWQRRGPFRRVLIPPFTPYTALILRDLPSDAKVHARETPLDRLLAEVEAEYHGVHLHFHPKLRDARTAVWREWDVRPLYTYVVDLASGPVLQEEWSRAAVRSFRGARERYDLISGDDAGHAAVRLVAQSYGRHRRAAPLPEDRLRALIVEAETAGLATSYAARHADSGLCEAAIVVLHDARTAAYWIAGSVPGDAMTYLLGSLLPELKACGIGRFDFVGANVPSIAEFKRRLGGSLESYYHAEYYKSRPLKLLQSWHDVIRRR